MLRFLEKYIGNPPMKAMVLLGIPLPVALLEVTGRTTGKARRVPVLNNRIGDQFWVIAEHGRRAGYVRNIAVNPAVRVKRGRRWADGTAHVLDDDDPFERAEWIAREMGQPPKVAAFINRAVCVDPVTVRIDLAVPPAGSGQPSGPTPAPLATRTLHRHRSQRAAECAW